MGLKAKGGMWYDMIWTDRSKTDRKGGRQQCEKAIKAAAGAQGEDEDEREGEASCWDHAKRDR